MISFNKIYFFKEITLTLGEGKLWFQTGAGGARLAFSGKSVWEKENSDGSTLIWFQTGADGARLASSGKSI